MLGALPPSALAGSPQCARLAGGGDSRTAAGGTSAQALAPRLIEAPGSRVGCSKDAHYLCSLSITHRPVIARSRGHQQERVRLHQNCAGADSSASAAGIKCVPAHPRHTPSRPEHAPPRPGHAPSLWSTALPISPSLPSRVLGTDTPQEDPSICSLVRSLQTPLSAPRAT